MIYLKKCKIKCSDLYAIKCNTLRTPHTGYENSLKMSEIRKLKIRSNITQGLSQGGFRGSKPSEIFFKLC